jgi:hypothetical protein
VSAIRERERDIDRRVWVDLTRSPSRKRTAAFSGRLDWREGDMANRGFDTSIGRIPDIQRLWRNGKNGQ